MLQTLCCCFPCLQRPEEEGKHEYNNVHAQQIALPQHELNLQQSNEPQRLGQRNYRMGAGTVDTVPM